MSKSLKGKHAVVTGGGRGIGAAAAKALSEAGAQLTLMGRNQKTLEQTAKNLGNARIITIDVTDAASVKKAFGQANESGSVDILINNAGAGESAPFHRTDEALWNRMLAVNLTGSFLCTKEVLGGMRQKQYGRIVNIASTAALKGYAYVSAYCAAKHGLLGMTRALAIETVRDGITVNAVCPGFTETDMLSQSIENIVKATGKTEEVARELLLQGTPLGRFVKPEEVASAVAWLCSDEAASTTGQAITIAGGELA